MRLPDWRARLTAYLAEWAGRDFAYGSADCWLFAMGAAEAVTGVDYTAGVRGYDSRESGLAMGREKTGCASHLVYVSRRFRKQPSVLFAQPGDLAAVDTSDGVGLGVVQGEMIYVLTPEGWGLIPLTEARGIYRV
ncbi:MAG: hypothetical protein Q4G24_10610 [Paracoccus sp. (in: a-proteobacteria)]|uniref:DUF6950 family protein n=1 Tax=Paracoccus sp. TaxID=267 RepID=UPI0026DF68DB|nr:hypothetical protein [Paracoccus sp. (in: a-proteobacteria)]MDO5621909.1 hypothetical protein [Paracoccus sp. (in: a-proteobacteria)]